ELVPVGRLEGGPLVWIARVTVGERVDPALRQVAGGIRLDVDRDVLVDRRTPLARGEVVVAATGGRGELLRPRLGVGEDRLWNAAFLHRGVRGHGRSSLTDVRSW